MPPRNAFDPLRTALVPVLLAAFVSTLAGAAGAQVRDENAQEQLRFGVEMAQRGLWSEALFRFRQAERIEPDSPSVVNNLAVAHEALGLFEEALELYRRGLELAPRDEGMRSNYARFVDFYQRFKPEEEGEEGEDEGAEDAADGAEPSVDDQTAGAGNSRR